MKKTLIDDRVMTPTPSSAAMLWRRLARFPEEVARRTVRWRPLSCAGFAAEVILTALLATACTPPNDGGEPEPTTTTTAAPTSTSTTSTPAPPPDTPTASDYIQWSCHETKPTCQSRSDWAESIDLAYTPWRGSFDLAALRDEGVEYLKGGEKELLDLTAAELTTIIERMDSVEARGATLAHRVMTEQHRDFDSDPLGEWHRSQVRKSVARGMISELTEQTAIYTEIAGAFPDVPGCDAIRCKVRRL